MTWGPRGEWSLVTDTDGACQAIVHSLQAQQPQVLGLAITAMAVWPRGSWFRG